MSRYYFLACVFPPLNLEDKPEISHEELQGLLELNLTKNDQKTVDFFRLYFDLQNLKAVWQGLPITDRGNFDENSLKEALLVPDLFPGFIEEYLLKYDSDEERLKNFAFLLTQYFQIAQSEPDFIAQYFSMERNLRLVLTALRAKQLHLDIVYQLQFEDPQDPLVAHILAQKDMASYEPTSEYHPIKEICRTYQNQPLELGKKLLEYRLQYLEELQEQTKFSLGQVLGYLISWVLIDQWQRIRAE